jgi:hypothetical protein
MPMPGQCPRSRRSSIVCSLDDDIFRTVGHTPNQNCLISSSLLSCIDVSVLPIRVLGVFRCIRAGLLTDIARSVSSGFRILMKLGINVPTKCLS